MSAPGGATTVGQIIGYLTLNRSDWDSQLAAAGRKADELSRHDPNIKISTNAPSAIAQLAAVAAATKRLQDAQGRASLAEQKLNDLRAKGDASASRLANAEEALARANRSVETETIRLAAVHDANDRAMSRAEQAATRLSSATAKVGRDADQAKPFVVNLWAALAAVAPAAVPIAGVAGGALLGLLPIAAAVTLGIKGISNQMKAGSLQGTQLATDVNTLKTELTTLENTAAGGLAAGLSKALSGSQPLFKTINGDIAVMSHQLGNIVGSAAPALLTVFTQLNPLFVTFGNLVANGAAHLEHMAQSGTGVTSFVHYVQAELPAVLNLLGGLVTLVSHVVQAAAPMGGAILGGLGLLVRLLDELPIGVLQVLVPLLVAGYAALKTYQGVTAIVSGVNRALATLGFAQTAAEATASSLAVRAATAEEEAAILQANAAIAASTIGTSEEMIAAYAAAAEEAVASAVIIRAAATAAAETVVADGEAAAVGWTEILGPMAAVAIGVAVLVGAFSHGGEETKRIAKAADSYSQSLKETTDALAAVNIQQTIDNLTKAKAYDQLDKLTTANKNLKLSYSDLTLAVNGSAQGFDDVEHKLVDIAKADPFSKTGHAALGLISTLADTRAGLQSQTRAQEQANLAAEQSLGINGQQAAAAAALYGLVGTSGVNAYLTATQAAQKNTEQTQAQTLAFQEENNAAGLVNQALQSLAGQNLSVAQAQTALGQANLTTIAALKQNGDTVAANTQAGLANRQAIEGSASALRSKLQADASAGASTEQSTATYRKNAQALLDQIAKLHGTKAAAYQYAQQLLAIPPVVKTKADLQTDAANARLAAFKAALAGVKSKVVSVTAVVYDNGLSGFAATVERLSSTAGVTVSYGRGNAVAGSRADGGTIGTAAGGTTVTGVGSARLDNRLYRLSVGEEVIKNPYAAKYRPLLKMANNDTLGKYLTSAVASRSATPQVDTGALAERVIATVMRELPNRIVLQVGEKELGRASSNGNLKLARRS